MSKFLELLDYFMFSFSFQGKRIVEIDKERPAWFSKNLMEKSTAGTSDCVDVKPTELA